MSHTATVKTQLKDVNALKAACTALRLPFTEGRHEVRLYSGSQYADFSCTLPGWHYPIALSTKSGEVKYDNFNGRWGDMAEFDKLHQEYALQVSEQTQDVQELIQQGWNVMRETQPNGDVHLLLTR